MDLSQLHDQRDILDRATIGVVQSDLDGTVMYANPCAMNLLGVDRYEGARLGSFFEEKHVLHDQLSSRRAGQIGSYRTRMRRASDGALVAIHVTATPIVGPQGDIVGSFALMRMPLDEEINRLHQEAGDANSVLFRVMQEVRKVVPFDLVTASRFSEDLCHCQVFFLYRPDASRAKVEWSKQWHWLPEPLQPEVAQTETRRYGNLRERLAGADVSHMRAGSVRTLIEEGVESCVRRPLRQHDKLVASVTFYSRRPDGFSDEQVSAIDHLPIAASVMQAIDYADRRRDADRYKLLREVAYCPTMEALYEALLRRLCDIFLWNNVAIYRVDHARGRIKLVAACQAPHAPVIEGLTYEQDIDVGILGRVVQSGEPQLVADVLRDPDFLLDDHMETAASELSWPVCVEDNKVRWIIDVTDSRVNAFAVQELRWLGEVAHEVGGSMQRLSTLSFLAACLDSASDPIVVVDTHGQVKRANPAAARLFGVPTTRDVTGPLMAFIASTEESSRALAQPDGDLGEVLIRHGEGTVAVGLSRRSLPADTGGAIYVFKDLRPIRRGLQLELMEKTTYDIALETRTPLMYAISALERLADDQRPLSQAGAERVLKYLYRVKHAYTKLAMFNANVRDTRGFVDCIDLGAELRILHEALPDEMRELVELMLPPQPVKIQGDRFEVAFVLETLLLFFVRTAPEELPVKVRLWAEGTDAQITIEGCVPADWQLARNDEGMPSELRLAYPLLRELLDRNGGVDAQVPLDGGSLRHELRFPFGG